MSVSEFEDQVLNYIWRGLVIAGLLTVLGGILLPTPSPEAQVPANMPSQRKMPGKASAPGEASSSPVFTSQRR
jgi:hypothetical protein